MANIIPILSEKQISEIPSRAEQKVYKSLEGQLSNDCLVIHSLEFIKQTSNLQNCKYAYSVTCLYVLT